MAKLLLLHGPNLNLLGEREPEIYGRTTLAEIETLVREKVEAAGHSCWTFQSNSEGAMVDWLQQNRPADFLLINAGALTHSSLVIADAIAAVNLPFVEIHISNVYRREPFRHHSVLAGSAVAVMAGFGVKGYDLATQFALDYLEKKAPGRR